MRYYIKAFPGMTHELYNSPIVPAVGVIYPEHMLLTTVQGWLECDGREIPCERYPELFRIVGFRFGQSLNPGYFKLPDLRNYRA